LEESVSLDISGPVQTVPALVTTTRDHELTKDELDELLPKPEPQRCYDWCVQESSKPFKFTAHSSVLQPG
jgi:hypothetical protein